MNTFLMNLMPGMMAKFEYASDLLAWARRCIDEIKSHKSTINYPEIDALLLSSLERAAQDIGSVPLLEFLQKLRAFDQRLVKTDQDAKDTGVSIEDAFGNFIHLKDEIPKLEEELRANRDRCARRSLIFFVVVALLILAPYIREWVRLIHRNG